MADNDNPHALRFLYSMTKHGEEKAGKQFAEEFPLDLSADEKAQFEWAKHVCAFMEDNYDDETVRTVRMDCVCGPTQEFCEELRKLYESASDPDDFVEKVNAQELGISMEYDGVSYYMIYPECYCSCVNNCDEQLTRAWCYCTMGYNKRLFEAVFEKDVQAELMSAVKLGDGECRIRITP